MAPPPSAPSANFTSGGMMKGGIAASCWSSQSVARPERARLDRRNDVLGPAALGAPAQLVESARRRLHPPEPAAGRRDQRGGDVVAETSAQGRAQIADAVDNAQLERLSAGPVFAGKHGFFGTSQPG